jgi:hypothetical protein
MSVDQEGAPLFHRDGDAYIPDEKTRGPWSEDAQHGGPVAALVAALLEDHETERALRVIRITYEFLRPLPLLPLTVRLRASDTGRSVQRIEVEVRLAGADQVVAVARALRMREKPVVLPVVDEGPLPPPPDTCPAVDTGSAPWVGLVTHGVEMRQAGGAAFQQPGPATVWFRLRQPVLDGVPLTPLQRVALVADFGNGISSVAPFADFLFVNADLTVAVQRAAEGEWICLDSASHIGGRGIGLTSSRILDGAGTLGHALQCLLVAARG